MKLCLIIHKSKPGRNRPNTEKDLIQAGIYLGWNKSRRARRRRISKTQRKQKAVVSSSLPRSRDRLPVCALPAKEALEAVSMETNWII